MAIVVAISTRHQGSRRVTTKTEVLQFHVSRGAGQNRLWRRNAGMQWLEDDDDASPPTLYSLFFSFPTLVNS